jgi:CBS domain containing-hemolysin-like protein
MTLLLFFIFLALCAEAFFAGTETAFVSVNFLKLMHLIEKKNKHAMTVHNLLKKPDRLLATTLIGTNLSAVAASACATALFARFSPAYSAILATVVITPIAFIFCQLLPKTIFRYNANRIVLYVAEPLKISEKIFLPLVNFFTFFANSIAKVINPHGLKRNPFLTKDEIKSLIKDISREGILEAHEKDAIDKIFDMTLTKAADIMVPLKNVVTVDVSEDVKSIKEKCHLSRFTRFPVFQDKTLIGSVNIYDIFYSTQRDLEKGVAEPGASAGWQSFARPILHINNDESLDKVFSKMQPGKEMTAAVFRGEELVGILTMEDLMEHITSKVASAKK